MKKKYISRSFFMHFVRPKTSDKLSVNIDHVLCTCFWFYNSLSLSLKKLCDFLPLFLLYPLQAISLPSPNVENIRKNIKRIAYQRLLLTKKSIISLYQAWSSFRSSLFDKTLFLNPQTGELLRTNETFS